MSEWQSIETAPEEGIFLAYFSELKFRATVWQVPQMGFMGITEHGYGPFEMTTPDLWMPLPAPPIKGNDNE